MPADYVVVFCAIGFFLSLAAVVWLLYSNTRLGELSDKFGHDRQLLAVALLESRDTFRRYAELHRAKNTPEGDKKAYDNDQKAETIDRILVSTGVYERHHLTRLSRSWREIQDATKQVAEAMRG